jgi:hypothetical protein
VTTRSWNVVLAGEQLGLDGIDRVGKEVALFQERQHEPRALRVHDLERPLARREGREAIASVFDARLDGGPHGRVVRKRVGQCVRTDACAGQRVGRQTLEAAFEPARRIDHDLDRTAPGVGRTAPR